MLLSGFLPTVDAKLCILFVLSAQFDVLGDWNASGVAELGAVHAHLSRCV